MEQHLKNELIYYLVLSELSYFLIFVFRNQNYMLHCGGTNVNFFFEETGTNVVTTIFFFLKGEET